MRFPTVFHYILFFVFWFSNSDSFAQGLCFENLTTVDGLPSSQVYDAYQADDGYIWFATDRGLVKYNGNAFKIFDRSKGVPSNTIFRFFPQPDGKVWCVTIENEWFWFESGEDTFNAFQYNDTLVKYANGALYYDFTINKGIYHFSFNDRVGVISISSEGKVLSQLAEQDEIAALDKELYIEVEDPSGCFGYWGLASSNEKKVTNWNRISVNIGNRSGYLSRSYLGNNQALFSSESSLFSVQGGVVNKFEFKNRIIGHGQFDESNYWMSIVGEGVRIYSRSGEEKAHYLEGSSVTGYLRDSHGGHWFTTLENGIFYSRSDEVHFHPIADNNIYSIARGKNGPMVSTIKGVLGSYNGESFVPRIEKAYSGAQAGVFNDKLNGEVYQVVGDVKLKSVLHRNNLTKVKLVLADIDLPLANGVIKYCEDGERPLLIASKWDVIIYDGKLKKFAFKRERIRSAAWKDDQVYIGTMRGLYLYDTLTKKSEHVSYPFPMARVEDIKRSRNCYFVGTMGDGVARIGNGDVKIVTEKNGLSSNLVTNVWPESDSVVWVATNRGLNRVLFGKFGIEVRVLDHSDGLPDNDISDVVIQNGRIWIGTRSGLCSISLEALKKFRVASSPKLFLQWAEIFVSGENRSKNTNVTFDFDQNSPRIHYDACYFANAKDLRFRYKWSKNQKEWVYTNERFIQFNQLNPGDYQLVVQASVDGEKWNKNQIKMSFTVLPPYYQTWWFRSFVAVLIGFLIYLFFRFRVLIYNKHLVREILRIIIRKIRPEKNNFKIRENGVDCWVNSDEVLFVKSDGNYIHIHTEKRKYFVREKISKFLELIPDQLEYVRVNRSYIIRLDKVDARTSKSVKIGTETIPVGVTYQKEVNDLLKS